MKFNNHEKHIWDVSKKMRIPAVPDKEVVWARLIQQIEIGQTKVSAHKNDRKPYWVTWLNINYRTKAILAFSRNTADYTLLEVGLGGEFDATNVVQNPVVSVITPISFDHKEYLGDTIKKIALAKAGIIKQKVPTVISDQSAKVKKILEEKCKANRSDIIWSAELFTLSHSKKSIIKKSGKKSIEFPFSTLTGTHQISNAMTAISTLQGDKIIH